MPINAIQRRRRRLAIALMLVQLRLTINRIWVHPMNNRRFEKGEFFVLYPDLRRFEDKFFNWFRMTVKKFDNLLRLIARQIRKQDTNYREAISAEEQLVITLT